MDRILRELFGGDEPEAGAGTRAVAADRPYDPEWETRNEAWLQRKTDAETRRSRKEFIERYTTGSPSEGFATDEAIAHLREMRDEMSPAEFRCAMQRMLEHLPTGQRDDFIKIMREYQSGAIQPAAGTGVGIGDLLEDLTKGGLRAPATAPGQQPTEADFRALLDSPPGRAVLSGVAAFGMQEMEEKNSRGAER